MARRLRHRSLGLLIFTVRPLVRFLVPGQPNFETPVERAFTDKEGSKGYFICLVDADIPDRLGYDCQARISWLTNWQWSKSTASLLVSTSELHTEPCG